MKRSQKRTKKSGKRIKKSGKSSKNKNKTDPFGCVYKLKPSKFFDSEFVLFANSFNEKSASSEGSSRPNKQLQRRNKPQINTK